jgi:TonB family protein
MCRYFQPNTVFKKPQLFGCQFFTAGLTPDSFGRVVCFMKNIFSCSIIFAIGLIIFSGCAQHSPPEFATPPEVSSPPGKKFKSQFLAEYIGSVRDKVKSNWVKPPGPHENLVIASFNVFEDGKIDKPVIEKSAGIEVLDSLALQAINSSVPFLKIPPEINKPSIHIEIKFQYVYWSE